MQRGQAAARPRCRSVPTPLQTCPHQRLPRRPTWQQRCSLRTAAPPTPLATSLCQALRPEAGLAEAARAFNGQWRRRRSRRSLRGGRRQPSSTSSSSSIHSSTLSSPTTAPAPRCPPPLAWPTTIPLPVLARPCLLPMATVAAANCVPAPLEATGPQVVPRPMVQVSAATTQLFACMRQWQWLGGPGPVRQIVVCLCCACVTCHAYRRCAWTLQACPRGLWAPLALATRCPPLPCMIPLPP